MTEHDVPLPDEPGDPREAGVGDRELSVEEVEPARLLAADVRDDLVAAGFSDEEVVDWARAYVANVDKAATSEELIAWIRAQQGDRA